MRSTIKETLQTVLFLSNELKAELKNENKETKPIDSLKYFLINHVSNFLNDLLLRKIQFEGHQTASADNLKELVILLADWWKTISSTDLSYPHSPNHPLNKLCMVLAQTLAPILKTSHYQLLMPDLNFDAIDCLSGESLQRMFHDKDLQLHQFILSDETSDKKQYPILIKTCLDSAISDGVLKQTTLFEQKVLNEAEITRLLNHSVEAKNYYQEIKANIHLKTEGTHIAAYISKLIDWLEKGGVRKQGGTEYIAGKEAYHGIKIFYQFVQQLSETDRNFLFSLTCPELLTGSSIILE